MKMVDDVILSLTVLILPAGCATPRTTFQADGDPPRNVTVSGSAREVRAVYGVLRKIEVADSNERLDDIVSLYTPDAMWLPPNRPVERGIETIRGHYDRLFRENDVTVRIFEEEILVSSPLAVCTGTTDVGLIPRDGGAAMRRCDRFLMVLRQDDGVWRMSHLMWFPACGAARK